MEAIMEPMTAYHDSYSPVNSAQSPASPTSNAGSPPKKHTRTYQACENPHEPPCARCKRERKRCVFDVTRRKTNSKRARSEVDSFDDGYQQPPRHPKRSRNPDNSQMLYSNGSAASPLNSSAYHGMSPASYPHSPIVDQETINRSANAMKKETYDGQNAMTALLEAAEQLTQQPRNGLSAGAMRGGGAMQGHKAGMQESSYPPEVVREAAAKHWSRFRFVRAGLINAREAMAYVDYFYVNCMPFTPVCIPDYRDPTLHQTLLEREPFLLMTILTIASRFMTLDGTWGKTSRPQQIHGELWRYLQKMFASLSWAQEQFGGGLSGGGKANASRNKDALYRYGLRSITTVESLMLLCEWAPRSLHFPPGDDDGQLVTPLNPVEEEDMDNEGYRLLNGDGNDRRDTWLEPAWRCDKMIWMLLHNAKALALEIGLFDDRTEDDLLQNTIGIPEDEIRAYHVRKTKTKEIFWAFYVQTCGRLELIGKLPRGYLESLHHSEADVRLREAIAIRKNAYEQGLEHPHTPIAQMAQYFQTANEATWFFWQEITAIMKSGNEDMFGQRENTRRIISSGEYRKWIHVYAPLLQEWRDEFDKCRLIPEPMRTILLIEYEYVRIYIHSLPLQAFVERAIASTPSKQNVDVSVSNSNLRNDSAASNGAHGVALEDVRKWMQEDAPYIQTLVESCQHVLSLIGESTIAVEQIKHFTVRVYFRIMGSAVHLLKDLTIAWFDYCVISTMMTDPGSQSFVVGAYADNVRRSFDLLQKASATLQTHIVDDVHIGAIFSEMIREVSKQIYGRLKRFTPGSRPGRSRAHSSSPPVAPSPVLPTANGLPNSRPPSGIASWSGNANGFGTPTIGGDNFINWPNDAGSLISNVEVYDTSNGSNMTVMPPPNFFNGQFDNGGDDGSANGNGMSNLASQFMNNTNNSFDWISMDMSSFVNLAANGQNNEVSNSYFGPQINGHDMLDHLRVPDGLPVDLSQSQSIAMVHSNGQRLWARS